MGTSRFDTEEFELPMPDGLKRVTPEDLEAIKFCQRQIREYRSWFKHNERRWIFWQSLTIVMGVIATIAGSVTIDIPNDWTWWGPLLKSLSWTRGIPAGIATIAAGMVGSFTFREDAVRHEMTRNALAGELAKFVAGAEPYSKHDDTDRSAFLGAVCHIIEAEQRNWSELVKSSKNRPAH
jgi:Protein of unknown function (DUF4231)